MDAMFLGEIAIGLACIAVVCGALMRSRSSRNSADQTEAAQPVVLVFEEDRLVDADDRIWSLLPDGPDQHLWTDVRLTLLPLIADLPDTLSEWHGHSKETGLHASLSQCGIGFRLVLTPLPGPQSDWFHTRQEQTRSRQMVSAVTHSPDLVWFLSHEGIVLWGNDAFSDYAKAHGGSAEFARFIAKARNHSGPPSKTRIELTMPGRRSNQNHWLEVAQHDTQAGLIFFATGIDSMLRAEAAQRNFVQTLSKTFANLTTGLAIFDRDRHLMLFNPALVDLSGVPIEFLSSRPAMFEFFDKLRECRIMPEPKSYDDWRERLAKLVAAASDDRFRETWALANGQTFDVTGQPYPDGAIAFLFNDITAEVSLTRGYRAELDTLQSVIDTFEDAVAVFDPKGILTVCNTAYAELWDVDPDASIPETTITDATQTWKCGFHPSPMWPELRDFVTSMSDRVSWDSELRGKDGREIVCRIDPICHGATLIRFCHRPIQRDSNPETDGLQIVSG